MTTNEPNDAMTDATLARHRIGIARLDPDGRILETRGADLDWLPPAGRSCFEAPALAGLEQAMSDLRDGRDLVLALPNVGLGDSAAKSTISIAWDSISNSYSLVSALSHGASETESMLVRERRQRKLADEQAEAARLRANINEALYRDIVESGADLVLRLKKDGAIVFANACIVAFCGAPLPAILGAQVERLLPASEGETWDGLAEKDEHSFEQRLVDASGQPVWILWRATWLGTRDGPAEYQVVGRDITLLKKLQAEIEAAHVEARSALVMRERLKIAHDLHDTIVQALVGVVAQLRAVTKVATRAPDRVIEELRQAELAARAGLERGREALGQVRFQRAGVEGLEAALRRAAMRLSERTGLRVECDLAFGASPVIGERAEILYRIAEEALRNIESHAQASCARLAGNFRGEEIEIVISDDGRGFDPASDYPGHYGLSGMMEQARMIGGRLTVETEIGRGARIVVRAPFVAGDAGGAGFAER